MIFLTDKDTKKEVKESLKIRGYGTGSNAIHRYQKENGLPVTSVITEQMANAILSKN